MYGIVFRSRWRRFCCPFLSKQKTALGKSKLSRSGQEALIAELENALAQKEAESSKQIGLIEDEVQIDSVDIKTAYFATNYFATIILQLITLQFLFCSDLFCADTPLACR